MTIEEKREEMQRLILKMSEEQVEYTLVLLDKLFGVKTTTPEGRI